MPRTSVSSEADVLRLRIRVRGAVQGVGFRPFVHRLATRHGLSGFILNDSEGVLMEVEGVGLERFIAATREEKPSLARIDGFDVLPMATEGAGEFTIRPSMSTGVSRGLTSADAAPCSDCLDDLFDASGRFHLYPFVTCTQCGPRFTILRALPYDRPNTAMAAFGLCTACASDYRDPDSRRFHAESIACPRCGPRLSHSIEEVAAALNAGQIIALKGIGCFHLMCDASRESAVSRLRRRKNRPDKPFAVMVANEASLDGIAEAGPAERLLLSGSARPVVLLRGGAGLAPAVAPGLGSIGLMLPSTPLHYLLFHALAGFPKTASWRDRAQATALVATSANIGGQPPIIDDDAADRGLAGIADLVVTHDRPILVRADDSVMAMIDARPAFIRRSRGFVPDPIDLGEDGPAVIAVGGHLKATLCVTRGHQAFMSQHVGDLGTANAVRFYEETAHRLVSTLGIAPVMAVCDLHPDYHSTRFADGMGLPVLRVQHHAAHVAAVAAEHHLHGPLLGVALDGHGQGDDGGAWGGELIVLDGARWRRLGHLAPLPMVGGDRAAREPWRMGVAALVALGRGGEAAGRFSDVPNAGALAVALGRQVPGAETTSMGRLFDAAAALLGLCLRQTYEGQAAMELEALVRSPRCLPEGYHLADHVLDFGRLLTALLEPGLLPAEGADLFHGTLIAGIAEWIVKAADQGGYVDIVLAGGCLMNRVLAAGVASNLRACSLRPWLPQAVPSSDGGLSLGQAAMARAQLIGTSAGSHATRR